MKRIVLACSAGMSTSLVVTKMEKEAEARGMVFKIYAIPEQNLRDELQEFGSDIIAVLLGPQVRFKLNENKKLTDSYQIPIAVIDSVAYGTLNGAKVLDQALSLVD
ncbi:PTS system, lichenan-specific IIb component [Pectobacterium atrosepticum SCRI1043]|uniref:PTS system, lichenan-specific IIb component n=1 Tax=Pectobacterium atrosepticum (strain SCRI 1043 / ATCC BAA-672) TaxID=218491 RepID=Q6D103_PECAS|nr:PTS sugar transporter subunit IIB [Pectobacterium atrosepticum]AIA72433.1 PTS cellobiose transporter subunit IIB [Pectobacterium atrosepticum]AIK15414.1 PTS system, cellobiose-specific IIB component [Pectobacterium atrosepticum]MCL6317870.1 PTS sugar transporter subunit IIB [Pectobacterium atrosepticum]MCL6322233.1 PTS sugar transporter subunit IIB [Pectobacterium atrosepticum]POW24158.1 PTS sugar transporter subunit IIB [Pectobacterium atrosepticum]